MTPDRTTLLDAFERATGRIPHWTEMLLLRNVGPVPPLTDEPGDTLHSRGFHVLLVDRRGKITHYAKCRASDDPRALREAEILEQLSGTSAASAVPRALVTHGARLQVIILEAIPGVRLDMRIRRQAAGRAPAETAAVLEAMDHIRSAVRVFDAPDTFEAGTALAPSFATLAGAGVESDALARLRVATEGTWPWRSQHGDLWPANIIWTGRGPVILDFEAFGEVGHPMFDAWHMIRCARHTLGERATWLDMLSPRTRADRDWRELLEQRQAQAGAPGDDLLAGLAWYVVQIAATLVERGLPERFLWGYLGDVRRVAGLLG